MEKLAISGGNPIREDKIPITKPDFGDEEAEAAVEVIKSGMVEGNGFKTEEFENSLAKYLNAKYVLFVNSCTYALHLSLMAANIKNGELLSSSYTFNSSVIVGMFTNLKPVLVDCEYETGNISLNEI